MKNADYYELLEVHRKASQEVISRAYRVMVSRFHPDTHPPERRDWATGKIKLINEAYAVLSDETKRAKYNTWLDSNASEAGFLVSDRVSEVDTGLCFAHQDRKRISICFTCRRCVCAECRSFVDGKPYCIDCAKEAVHNLLIDTSKASANVISDEPISFLDHLTWLDGISMGIFAVTCGLWLYFLIAPAMVIDTITLVLALTACLLVGIVCSASVVVGLARTRLQRSMPFKVSLLTLCLIVSGFGIQNFVLSVQPKIGVRIQNVSIERQEKSAYESFSRAWRDLTQPDTLFEQIKDFGGQKQYKKFIDLENISNGENQEIPSFPSQSFERKKDNLEKTMNCARDYLALSKSFSNPEHRIECLHFAVWVANNGVIKMNAKQQKQIDDFAQECIHSTNNSDAVADCLFYLVCIANQSSNIVIDRVKPFDSPYVVHNLGIVQQVRIAQVLLRMGFDQNGEISLSLLGNRDLLRRQDSHFDQLANAVVDRLRKYNLQGLKKLNDLCKRNNKTFPPALPPTINLFKPTEGKAGENVTITGTNLSDIIIAGADAVKFNGIAASDVDVKSSTSITAIVPDNLTAGGIISVTTTGGTARSTTFFTFIPKPSETSTISNNNKISEMGSEIESLPEKKGGN